jgi:predicted nuclease of predicted toxin-antitoxin system
MGSASRPSVVWVRLGNIRKQVLLNRIGHDWGKILALLDARQRLMEMR